MVSLEYFFDTILPATLWTWSRLSHKKNEYQSYLLPSGPVQACNGIASFDVHGSVHLGNIYVQFKVQLNVLFYVFFILLYS
jgi:hypothetical protein